MYINKLIFIVRIQKKYSTMLTWGGGTKIQSTKKKWLFFLYFHEIWFLAGLKTVRFNDVEENIIKSKHIFLGKLLEKYAVSPSEE